MFNKILSMFLFQTYDLVSEVKGFTFFPLMRDFETQTTDSDYITDIFAFINAYILCESTFDSRMKAREEFTSFGLLDIIQNQEFKDLLSSSDTQSATALKIQLDFFTQQMADDETMALQPVHEVITQLSNTEVFSQTKVILQKFEQFRFLDREKLKKKTPDYKTPGVSYGIYQTKCLETKCPLPKMKFSKLLNEFKLKVLSYDVQKLSNMS